MSTGALTVNNWPWAVVNYDSGYERHSPEPHSERGCLVVLIEPYATDDPCDRALACVTCDVWIDRRPCDGCFFDSPSQGRGVGDPVASVVAAPTVTAIIEDSPWLTFRPVDPDPDARHIQRIKDTLMKGGSK